MSILDFKFTSKIGNFSLNASSEFNEGINFIWGRSGNGKTTLLNNLAGFLKPIQGEITISNKLVFSTNENINLSPENRNISYEFSMVHQLTGAYQSSFRSGVIRF